MPGLLKEHLDRLGENAMDAGAALGNAIIDIIKLAFWASSVIVETIVLVPIAAGCLLWKSLRKRPKTVEEKEQG